MPWVGYLVLLGFFIFLSCTRSITPKLFLRYTSFALLENKEDSWTFITAMNVLPCFDFAHGAFINLWYLLRGCLFKTWCILRTWNFFFLIISRMCKTKLWCSLKRENSKNNKHTANIWGMRNNTLAMLSLKQNRAIIIIGKQLEWGWS